jgi:hypothetical protein
MSLAQIFDDRYEGITVEKILFPIVFFSFYGGNYS